MIHTNNPIIKHKAGLLNLAEEMGNVSKACKMMGVSRDTFYRYQELIKDGDIDSLVNKTRRTALHSGWHIWTDLAYYHRGISILKKSDRYVIS